MDAEKLTKAVNQMIINDMIELESVGCLLDTDVGSVYPILKNGEPDWENEFSLLDEVSDEWIHTLSEKDFKICKDFLQ